jgi:hypothetical protein
VVNSVVSCPMPDTSLVCYGVGKHKPESKWVCCLVRSVRPKSVNTTCNANSTVDRNKRGDMAVRRCLVSNVISFRC